MPLRDHQSSQTDNLIKNCDPRNNPRHIEYYNNAATFSALSPDEICGLLAFRFGIISGKRDLNVTQILTCRLGSIQAATHMHRLMSKLAGIWEGPFLIGPPCSSTLTLDEALMCQLLRCAMRDNRGQFEETIGPLLESKSIPEIWHMFRNVATSLMERHKI